jgi:hypothetical protein
MEWLIVFEVFYYVAQVGLELEIFHLPSAGIIGVHNHPWPEHSECSFGGRV